MISRAAQTPAAAMAVPSPSGRWKARPCARAPQQRQHAEGGEDLGGLDEREGAECADHEEERRHGGHALLQVQRPEELGQILEIAAAWTA